MADRDIEQVADLYAPPLRVLVTGSRSWADRYAIRRALLRATNGADPLRVVVIHGGASGADALADQIARGYGWAVEPHPADWDRHGRSVMLSLGADLRLVFAARWDSGTGHCARLARDAGIRTEDWGVDTRAARHMPGEPDLFGEVRHVG